MKKSMKFARTLAVVNTAALAAVILINALANTLPINGITTGDLSDRYPNLFVPAGITFSIWGLIYLLLIMWVIYQIRISSKDSYTQVLQGGPWFLVSSVGNILWILFWHYQLVFLSMLAMLLILLSLIKLYLVLEIGFSSLNLKEKIFYHVPVSVYLGWISVATIANMTALLVNLQWGGFGLGEAFWTIFVIAAGTVVGLLMILRRNDLVHPVVVIWAYAGIILKRSADADPVTSIIIAAWAASAVIAAVLAVSAVKKRCYLSSQRY